MSLVDWLVDVLLIAAVIWGIISLYRLEKKEIRVLRFKAGNEIPLSENEERKRGFILAIEGLDGVGKTPLAHYIVSRLTEAGKPAVYLKMGGDLADWNGRFVDMWTRFLGWARELVDLGFIVVCDRFIPSAYAYQSVSLGLSFDEIKKLLEIAGENEALAGVSCKLIFLDRVNGSGFEGKSEEEARFLRKVEACYRQLLSAHPDGVMKNFDDVLVVKKIDTGDLNFDGIWREIVTRNWVGDVSPTPQFKF